jgi:hypothetical protein
MGGAATTRSMGGAATTGPLHLTAAQLQEVREAPPSDNLPISLSANQMSQAGLVDANAASRTAWLSFLRGFLVGASAMFGGWLIQHWLASNPQNTAATAPARPGGVNPDTPPLGAQNWGRSTNPSMPPLPNLTAGYGEGNGFSNGRRPDGQANPADTGQDKKRTAPEPVD